MPNIDELNIELTADAKSAISAIDLLVGKLGELTKALGKINTKGIKDIAKISDQGNAIKKVNQDVGELAKKFKDVGKIKVGDMGLDEVQKNIARLYKRLDTLAKREEKTKLIGGDLTNVSYDISSALNELSAYEEKLKEILAIEQMNEEERFSNIPITDMGNPVTDNMPAKKEVVSSPTISVDEALKKAGVNSAEMEKVSSAAKKVSNEIMKSAGQTKDFLNKTDDLAEKWKQIKGTLENTKYPKDNIKNVDKMIGKMSDLSVKMEEFFNKREELTSGKKVNTRSLELLEQKIKKTSNEINQLGYDVSKMISYIDGKSDVFNKIGKSTNNFSSNVHKKVIKPLKAVEEKTKKVGASFSGAFSVKRMVGMSVLYSLVFRAISGIETAFREGMESLSQYSTATNQYMSGMVSSLTTLKNSFAAAFNPILTAVIPILSAFIQKIASVINMIGQLAAALSGSGFAVQAKKVQKDYAAGLKDTAGAAGGAGEAVEDLKNATLGFDELHVLETPKDTSGSGGGATDIMPEDMFETVEIDENIKSFADRLKELIPIAAGVGAALLAWKIAPALLKGLQYVLDTLSAIKNGHAGLVLLNSFQSLKGVLSNIFPMLTGLSTPMLLFGATIGIIVGRFVDLYQNSETFRTGLERLGETVGGIKTVFTDVFEAIGKVVSDVFDKFADLVIKVLEFFGVDTTKLKELIDKFKEMISQVDLADVGITALGIALLAVPGGQIFGALLLGFEAVTIALRALGGLSDETWEKIKTSASEKWEAIKTKVSEIFEGIKNLFPELRDYYSKAFTDLIEAGKNLFTSFINGIIGIFEGAINAIIKALNKIKVDIPEWVPGIGGKHFGLNISLANLPRFEDGGFPEDGLFLANHTELVGQFSNGRTAVANNDQIIKGIAEGVYSAVLSAMNDSGGQEINANLTVELDGETIYRNQQRIGNTRGYNFNMGAFQR